jgi:hypothetical protein
MSAPKIVYNTGSGDVTLAFVRGPLDFLPEWAPVVHDNVASSGAARERVVENRGILIPFTMPGLTVGGGDLAAWMTFMGWAIGGGAFKFYPNAALTSDWYNCVEEAGAWQPRRVAPGVYSAAFRFRVLMDSQAPADPGTVLRRFMGVTG